MVENLLHHFELNQVEEGQFRLFGGEYSQAEDFGVYVTCKNNIEKILPVNFVKGIRGPEHKATAAEIAQARSLIGSFAWIARQVRPDLLSDQQTAVSSICCVGQTFDAVQ